MTLQEFLDCNYGAGGADPNTRAGPGSETLLHVATRRRRLEAVKILLEHGAEIDARNAGGKTAYAHAVRRSFDEVATLLREEGSSTSLNEADRLADAVAHGRLDEARQILADHPRVVRTGNPEEDRLLADVAGHNESEPVKLLIGAGADLAVPGMEDGTPLHAAAWFGQPDNARLLIDAGAPLDVFDSVHNSSPIGWAVHGSRYSGGVEWNQDAYVALVRMLLAAGSALHYPGDAGGDGYPRRLREDASPAVRETLDREIPRPQT